MKISVRFQGLKNIFLVLLACNVMKQTLSYPALYESYISKRLCCYNIFHLFKIVGNLTEIFTGKKKILKSTGICLTEWPASQNGQICKWFCN